jgi:hypothetical protein
VKSTVVFALGLSVITATACSPTPRRDGAAAEPTAAIPKPQPVERSEEDLHSHLRGVVLSTARQAMEQKDYRTAFRILNTCGGIPVCPDWLYEDKEVKSLLVRVKKELKRHEAVEDSEGKGGRREFAVKLRQLYLDQGFDIKVHTKGRNAERLMLEYVLFDAVWTNAFKKSDTFFAAGAIGFRSVELNNGYNYHVLVSLK